MPIASAVERGSQVYVYDEKGRCLFTVPFENRPGLGLQGYTSSTVSVKRAGGSIYTYGERGNYISVVPGK